MTKQNQGWLAAVPAVCALLCFLYVPAAQAQDMEGDTETASETSEPPGVSTEQVEQLAERLGQLEQELSTLREKQAQQAQMPSEESTKAAAEKQAKMLDGSWSDSWGLVFTITGLNTGGILRATDGLGASGIYFLDSRTAIRAGVDVFRTHDPRDITKTTFRTGDGEDVIEYDIDGGSDDTSFGAQLIVDYLIRLTDTEVAPYIGGGISMGYDHLRAARLNDVEVEDYEEEVDVRNSGFDIGLRGLAGAEWRVHPSISLFAEYGLTVTVFDVSTSRTDITDRAFVDGELVGEQVRRVENDETQWLPLSLGVGHAGRFGLTFHF